MILKGDCIEVMKAMKPNSVDAIVCDPPYNLHFMGKDWDKDLLHEKWLTEAYRVLKPGGSMLVMGGTRTSHRLACAIEDTGFIIKDTLMWLYGSGFPKAQDLGKMIDKRLGKEREIVDTIPSRMPQAQAKGWGNPGIDRFRDAKKGTVDLDVTTPTTDLAKHWDGFKVGGIKPAYEPIIWAVKPPEGSYVDNVLKWGVGAVNVDECRVRVESDDNNKRKATGDMGGSDSCFGVGNKYRPETLTKGRFPANVILSHHPECVQMGMKRVKSGAHHTHKRNNKVTYSGKLKDGNDFGNPYADPDGLETVESWDCHPDCAVRLLDEQSGEGCNSFRKNPANRTTAFFGNAQYKDYDSVGHNDSGGASRFFYCAKASRGERNAGLEGMEEKEGQAYRSIRKNRGKGYPESTVIKNNHPTVKPIKLFEYLIKLVTREGQIVLDPFIGSGTTAIAAHNTGRKCIGIEKEDEYLTIAKRRINHWKNQPKQMEIRI